MGKYGQVPITQGGPAFKVTAVVPTMQLINQLEQFLGAASPYAKVTIDNYGYLKITEPE